MGLGGKDAASLIARDAAADPILRHVPILFLTTFVNGAAMDAPFSLSGGTRFVAKQVNLIRLLQSVANFAGPTFTLALTSGSPARSQVSSWSA